MVSFTKYSSTFLFLYSTEILCCLNFSGYQIWSTSGDGPDLARTKVVGGDIHNGNGFTYGVTPGEMNCPILYE